MKIELPKAADWSGTENCAINLRSVSSAGVKMCEPVGMPDVVLNDAGAATYLLDHDDVMSVSDDRHDVYVNEQLLGSLTAPLINVLPLGTRGEAILFGADGVRMLSQGALQDVTPTLPDSALSPGASDHDIAADVLIGTLTGSYPRASEMLDDTDSARVTAALNDTLAALTGQANSAGLFTQPIQVAWRMVDDQGRVVASGTPTTIGEIQCNTTLVFKMQRDGEALVMAIAPTMSLTPWALHVSVERHAAAFWRNKAAALEVVAWPSSVSLKQRGYVLARNSTGSIDLTASTRMEIDYGTTLAPRLVARIEHPLEGVDCDVVADFEGPECEWYDFSEAVMKPTALYRGGSIVAYAEASNPGMLQLASIYNPLQIKGLHKICGGNILHICAPVGGGGGWNYGRLHLLVFATDGIYSVSVDSKLTAATSTCVNYVGISSGDAVAATPECVYVATSLGQLLRIVGARCHMVAFPSEVAHLAWNGDRAELWAINDYGAAFVMDADSRVALRSNVYVERVVGQCLIVDQFGALRTLRRETPVEVDVNWICRREDTFGKQQRRAVWKIDAHHASALTLRLRADNGGTSQRLLELRIDGSINAPVSARIISPRRAYFTAQIQGKVMPPAHFNSLDISP